MERSEFKERLRQYKQAREENPGLKYWEWKAQPAEKDIPKYDEGTGSVAIDSIKWNGPSYAEIQERLKKEHPVEYNLLQQQIARNTQSGEIVYYTDASGNKKATTNAKGLEIVSPEFEILSGGIGVPRQLYENRMKSLAKELVSELSEKTISKGITKTRPYLQRHLPVGETFNVSEDVAKELSAMYRRNISSETDAILSVLGKKRTPSKIQFNLNAAEREWLRKHNVDETILSGKDIKKLKQLRQQSITEAVPTNERFILTSPTAEHSQLQLFKNTLNKPTQIGYIEYGTDPYSYMNYLGRQLQPISNIDLSNHVTVDMIENISNGLEKGISKDLYNGLAHVMQQRFPENGGFVTGMKLLSPEATTKTLNKLNKKLISNQGEYGWATGTTLDNPIYSITNTTGNHPVVKSLMFDPKAIKNGKIITDLTNPDIHFAEGGTVGNPPTYEQWYEDVTRPKLTVFDDAQFQINMKEAAADLHNMAMELPGYADKWNEYMKYRPKEAPQIDQFVDDLWQNENPNNVGYKKGRYYPHKSPEGGAATIGPGFKIGSGSHRITEKEANKGVTRARLDREAARVGQQHLDAVNQFLNYGQTTNPADTVSPQIKMGLMDLRHQVGPLNGWHNLRNAVLEGDLNRIKKESTVTWEDNGKTRVDTRRKKIRDTKYFHY